MIQPRTPLYIILNISWFCLSKSFRKFYQLQRKNSTIYSNIICVILWKIIYKHKPNLNVILKNSISSESIRSKIICHFLKCYFMIWTFKRQNFYLFLITELHSYRILFAFMRYYLIFLIKFSGFYSFQKYTSTCTQSYSHNV